MVKVKTITHQPTSAVVHSVSAEHPFSKAREFQRAFQAVKLEKIFAQPFVASMPGHSDGISCMAKCPIRLNKVISGAHDGEIRIWDISERKTLISTYAHQQSVKGVTFSRDGQFFVSSSSDKSIHLYNFAKVFENESEKIEPTVKFMSKNVIFNVDHCWDKPEFATAGQFVQIWSYERSKPIHKLPWGSETILKVKYNPAQTTILCGTGIDRSITLYDLRGESPIQKIYLGNKSPCVSWNPIEPINFTVGNDDSNCYTFDMRKMDKAKIIHKDHISSVMDIDYAPTGREFVTGSYDKTIRIFQYDKGKSRQAYHSKRMQLVSSVIYSMDAHYVLSGSEDMNVRIWKAQASKPLGQLSDRQQRSMDYRSKLVQKFQHSNKIRRISKYRHLPKYILNAKKQKQQQVEKHFRKTQNVEANTGRAPERQAQKQRKVDRMETE